MSEKISSPKTLTVKTLTIMDAHEVQGIDTIFDNFGVGADVGLEL